MRFTKKDLGQIILTELEKGFDIVGLSQAALAIQQEYGHELTDGLDTLVQQLMAMEEGPEFEMSEYELRALAGALSSSRCNSDDGSDGSDIGCGDSVAGYGQSQ